MKARQWPATAPRVPEPRRLDLDHIGAEVGQDRRGGRTGDPAGAVDHLQAAEHIRCHQKSRLGVVRPRWLIRRCDPVDPFGPGTTARGRIQRPVDVASESATERGRRRHGFIALAIVLSPLGDVKAWWGPTSPTRHSGPSSSPLAGVSHHTTGRTRARPTCAGRRRLQCHDTVAQAMARAGEVAQAVKAAESLSGAYTRAASLAQVVDLLADGSSSAHR